MLTMDLRHAFHGSRQGGPIPSREKRELRDHSLPPQPPLRNDHGKMKVDDSNRVIPTCPAF
ncbi:MAG: hypothetical protein C6W56_16720 [Caldibacillus debilis]|nr:MAG: hypothetical protein C6W56_16720 [Caldibacillus debilis]